MKKRILACVLAMVFVFASVMGVSAAGSKDGQATVTGGSTQKGYIIREGVDKFKNDQMNNAYIPNKDAIEKYNAKEIDLATLLTDAPNVYKELKGKKALTPIFDLHDVNGGEKDADGYHRVTINVPTLSSKCTGVKVLHYSMGDANTAGKWEILEKSTYDLAKKQVTVVSDDLSPIAIFATVSAPLTGVQSSTWMIFAAVALVAAGSVVVISRKKRA